MATGDIQLRDNGASTGDIDLASASTQVFTHTGSGGLSTGGAATKLRTFAQTASGGITTGGAATKLRTFAHEAEGGSVTGGAATKLLTFSCEAEGGLVSGGDATKTRTFAHPSTGGGAVTGGSAAHEYVPGSITYTHVGAGGLITGGVAYTARTFAHIGAGGLITGGVADHSRTFAHTTLGGITTGGAATKSIAIAHEGTGGISTGGEATTLFRAPNPLPTETKLQSLEIIPTTLPALPALPTGLDPDLRRLLMNMKERLEIAGGDIASYGRAITYYDVATAPPGAFVNVPNDVYTTPPAATGLTAAGAFTSVTLSWDMAAYFGHGYTEVWRYPTDAIGSATLNSTWYGAVGSDLTATGTGYYYWIRHVNKAGTPGPFNAVAGTFAATSPDVDFLLTSLENKITELQLESETVEGQEAFIFNTKLFAIYDPSAATNKLPFAVVSAPFTNNGVNVPAGVYMRDAFIQNGAIVNAKIGNLAVDDAKIANLSATKITAGDVAAARMQTNFLAAAQATITSLSSVTANIGDIRAGIISNNNAYLPSFYRYVNLNATADSSSYFIAAHNSSAQLMFGVRGDGVVSIGGPNATLMGGAMTGYAWPASGLGFYLGPSGFLVGNANSGSYFQWDYSTNVAYCNGINIYGNSNFYGALQGATGTFSGALSAASGTFTGALVAATGTFSGSLSAASGTFSGSLTASAVNAVSTVNIAGNAVTIPIYAEVGDGGSQTSFLANPAAIIDLGSQMYYGGTVVVMITVDISSPAAYIYVQRDGSNIKAVGVTASAGRDTKNITFADAPGAGAHNYRVLIVPNGTSVEYRRYYANLLTLEARR